ncbi:glycosyltransferase family 4 protein [Frigoribacterium sp. PhB24]|uniref:glycosyltransferase family 4 protein n=1 Tax=Frigoribacterium sp. PhB24 TaxID=2485204 RepID=UPI000F47BBAB|nr:glycosyltransferase family 4 protein [Frigoribacterium sp. PhB24]ROS54738.1 glycosyltransferase involved in cell wall biosynthesis [Frigoribacterium sp. PhB24]
MRIIYLHQYFRTPTENGGVRSYHFAQALRHAGHDVEMVTSDRSLGAPGYAHRMVDGISVHYFGVPYQSDMGVARRLVSFASFAVRSARRVRKLRGDAIVATSTPLTIVIPALWGLAFRRTRFVFEVRDLWPSVPVAMGVLRNRLLILAAESLERLAYRKADVVVALSPGMADGVRAKAPLHKKIVVVPNIADVEMFGAGDEPSPDPFEGDSRLTGRRLVMYCGAFGRVNGLDYMVELAAASARIGSELVFVAVGEGAEKARVIERAQELGVLDTAFVALPAVGKKDLPVLLARASYGSSWVIDVPALENNSANKFFDTLAAARPVLLNHGGWQAEMLESRGAGLSLSRDPGRAAVQLERFDRDVHARDQAGVAARRVAEGDFSLPILSATFVREVEGSSEN